METNNQKIVFSLPEEGESLSEIISSILKKNNITEDTAEDLSDEKKIPKVLTFGNTAKNLFGKKITEEKVIEIFQNEFKISKEIAIGVINDIKDRLFPFGKKVEIPSDNVKINPAPKIINNESFSFPNTKEEIIEEKNNIFNPTKSTKIAEKEISTSTAKPRTKKIPDFKSTEVPNLKQKSGPDTYREPIE